MKYLFALFALVFSLVAQAGNFLPVLMYHHVTTELAPGEEMVSPSVFTQQMQALKQRGYSTVTMSEATKLLASGSLPPKLVAITFDDGWKSQLQAAGVLASLDYTATFFIITGMFETPRYMTTTDVKWLSTRFEIGAHSETHFMKYVDDLSKLDSRTMREEMANSKYTLEALLGKPIKTLAWPFGYARPETIEFAKHIGFTSQAMIYTGRQNTSGGNPHDISRLNIDGRCSLDVFLKMVETGIEQRCK